MGSCSSKITSDVLLTHQQSIITKPVASRIIKEPTNEDSLKTDNTVQSNLYDLISSSEYVSSSTDQLHDCEYAKQNGRKSVIGLDTMIKSRRTKGHLKSNVVHIEAPYCKLVEEAYSGVHDGMVLGRGASGLVRLVTHRATGVQFAVKCLDLALLESEESRQQLREEIHIMSELDHPNIVRLEEVYESKNEIYLVEELCLGGELFDHLEDQYDYHFTEQDCAHLVKQMMSALRYMHSKGIVHRDLKLENFLFATKSHDSELKLIDFGYSKHFTRGEVMHDRVGTPYTAAPEVILGNYDEKCDVWSIGVIAFLVLCGETPFGGLDKEPLLDVRRNILAGSFKFDPEIIWSEVSKEARNFISALLVTNPKERPTVEQAQKSPWLRQWANAQNSADQLNPDIINALVKFKEYSDVQKLLCEVLSFALLPDQTNSLIKDFEKMDVDGNGEISLNSLKSTMMQNTEDFDLSPHISILEQEVEDIFNAMRLCKSEPNIHWHEFIAASLSQCKVDDRNMLLAFDRLDFDHKGYICFSDVVDMMGIDATEDYLTKVYQDALSLCECYGREITYADFALLAKTQIQVR